MNHTAIQRFYDDFLESNMLRYRLHGNRRLEKATARILPELRPGDRVLDVGCGIGMVTERMADAVAGGHVWGVDISEEIIWYARQTATRSNLTFFAGDVTSDFDAVARRLDAPVNVVTLIDVIEHIPASRRAELLTQLRRISADEAVLILTYPSPQYQRYLHEHHPDELQIIDNVIELPELLHEAQQAGYTLRHYSLETVWKKHQYVHCIFQTDVALTAPQPSPWMLLKEGLRGVAEQVDRLLLLPFRKRKYVDRVFR